MKVPKFVARAADRLRDRLKAWLGVEDWRKPVHDLREARRAVVALDLALKQERGMLIMLVPRPPREGGDLVKVFELPAGMTMDETRRMVGSLSNMVQALPSLWDVPVHLRPAFEVRGMLPDPDRYPDHLPRRPRPSKEWAEHRGLKPEVPR